MNRRPTEFTVEGVGRFPVDMLRYEQAYPASEADAGQADFHDDQLPRRRRVRVCAHYAGAPSRERWQSFNWKVIDEGEAA